MEEKEIKLNHHERIIVEILKEEEKPLLRRDLYYKYIKKCEELGTKHYMYGAFSTVVDNLLKSKILSGTQVTLLRINPLVKSKV